MSDDVTTTAAERILYLALRMAGLSTFSYFTLKWVMAGMAIPRERSNKSKAPQVFLRIFQKTNAQTSVS